MPNKTQEIQIIVRSKADMKAFVEANVRLAELSGNTVKYNTILMKTSTDEARALAANMKLYDQLPTSIAKSGVAVDGVGKKAGVTQRTFSNWGSAAATAFSFASSGAGSANREIANLLGTATALGRAAIFTGGVGLAITALGLAVSQLTKEAPEVAALNQELSKLAEPKAAQALAQLLGVTEKQAGAMLLAAQASSQYAAKLKQTTDEVQQANSGTLVITKSFGALYDVLQQNVVAGLGMATDKLAEFRESSGLLKGALDFAFPQIKTLGALAQKNKELGASAKENVTGLEAESRAQIETNRVRDIAKNSLPQLVAENKNHARAVSEAAVAHRKAQASFSADAINAQVRATESLTQAQKNYGRSLEEAARGRGRAVEDDARARVKLEQDTTNSILRLNQNLADEIAGINRDSIDEETSAVTYAEVIKIRAKVQQRLVDANKKANEARIELESRKREQLEEANFQKARRDEDYTHQRELLDRSLSDSRQAAQAQLNDALAAIQTRRAEENTAFEENKKKSAVAHAERIIELTDTRTETQKIDEAAQALGSTHDANIQKLIEQWNWTNALAMAQAQVGVSGGFGTSSSFPYRPEHQRAGGGDVMRNRAYVVGERGPELFIPGASGNIVPNSALASGRSGGGGSREVAFYNYGTIIGEGDFRQWMREEIDRDDRGQ